MIHPIPERHARRAAGRDARAARDHRDALRGVFDARRLRRGRHAGARVRGRRWRAATRAARRARLPAVRRAGQRARAALGHDDPDRARGRRRATRRPSRRCASATSPTPTARVRPQRGQPREILQAGIELVGAPGAGGHGRGARRCCATRSTPSGCADYRIGLGDASLYPALLDALGVPEAAPRAGSCTSSSRATSSAWSARSSALRPRRRGVGAAAARAAAARRRRGARRRRAGGRGGGRLRARARAAGAARRPSG